MVATLATALPEIIPKREDATTATFAGPPLNLPMTAVANSLNSLLIPTVVIVWPKKTKIRTMVTATSRAVPKIPCGSRYKKVTRF